MLRLEVLSALAAAVVGAGAQQIGTLTKEVHPFLPSWKCTIKSGCIVQNTSIVLDSDYRWTHTVGGYDNCKGASGLDAALCPNATACAKNCALEGVDYASYGVFADSYSLTLNMFVNDSSTGKMKLSSPRVYLLTNESTYDMFHLLDKEFTFTVDVSKLPCGTNGALYLTEMEPTGGQGPLNPAGAAYGTGYCDAQCPTNSFINGEANLDGHGACCNEMDIWEANSQAQALTPHPCNITGVYKCVGDYCGTPDRYAGVCDQDGCDYNPYRLGAHSFYRSQPNATVDTTRPFTVVTQFLTAAGNGTGDLVEIRRLYVQDGKVIQQASTNVTGVDKGNAITDGFCAQEKKAFGGAVNAFASQGGLKGMGGALGRGMVLAMSIWDDASSAMKWLDATYPDGSDPVTDLGTGRGPCPADAGSADGLLASDPGISVTFSEIKTGEIGSTYRNEVAAGSE